MKTKKLKFAALVVLMSCSVISIKLFAQTPDVPLGELNEKETYDEFSYSAESDFPGINPHTFNNWGSGLRSGTGDFLVSNYATGYAFNDFFWRGYAFRVSRTVTVTELWGGWGNTPSPCGATAFNGAIFSATLTGGTLTDGGLSAPQVRPTAVLTSVGFTSGAQTDGEPVERVALSESLVLEPGNLYIIAQGSLNNGSSCHRASNQLDVTNLLLGNMIIDEWYPAVDRAYRFGGAGSPASRVNANADRLDPFRVLVGFRYMTGVDAPEITDVETKAYVISGTNDVLLTGLLANSGIPATGEGAGTDCVLYFEVSAANAPTFTGSTLYSADNIPGSKVTGPATDVDFSRTLSNFLDGKTPGDVFYFRAVAINEFGRINGQTMNFTVGELDDADQESPPVPLHWLSIILAALAILSVIIYRWRS